MNNITRIDTGIQNSDVKYTIKWAEMIKKSLSLSPLFSFFSVFDREIRDGQIVLPKSGASEKLAALRSEIDYNTWSNKDGEVIIPFNTGFSTESILLSPNEYLQYSNGSGVPFPLTEQSLSVKADKVTKSLAKVMSGLIFEGKTEDGLTNGDGAIPQIDFTWTTTVGISDREDVAKEFEKFVYGTFDKQMETITRIGLSDLTGKNSEDFFRTGVDTNSSQYKIFTDFDFRRRWEIWKSRYNYETGVIEKGSYGSILGYQLYQDKFLPYVGITTTGMTGKSLYGNKNTVSIIEGTKNVGLVALKSQNVVRGKIYNEMWEEPVKREKNTFLVGWNLKFGAGTYNSDEMFCVNFTVPPVKYPITTNKNTYTITGTGTDTIQINNFAQLTGVTVTSSNTAQATVSINGSGLITIKGVNAGSPTITIKATNATADKVITGTVS